ncbi:MAG: putative transposase [Parasphingorhabdus sp.]
MTMLCRILKLTPSGYYAWCKRPGKLITSEELHLHRRAKKLFVDSRESLGSRELSKKLQEEGLAIGRYKTRNIMKRLRLIVRQRIAYKVTTQHKHSDTVADNLLNMNFNPVAADKI